MHFIFATKFFHSMVTTTCSCWCGKYRTKVWALLQIGSWFHFHSLTGRQFECIQLQQSLRNFTAFSSHIFKYFTNTSVMAYGCNIFHNLDTSSHNKFDHWELSWIEEKHCQSCSIFRNLCLVALSAACVYDQMCVLVCFV